VDAGLGTYVVADVLGPVVDFIGGKVLVLPCVERDVLLLVLKLSGGGESEVAQAV